MIQKSNSKKYWRSLDELHGSTEFEQAIEHDFGGAAPPPEMDGLSRRRWLQLMGASLAFGTMAGCRYPDEVIAPFAFRPQGRAPGVPENFVTMLEMSGVAKPLLATSYDGRPVKLDGNPEHRDSRKASDSYTQAAILELYDPDRSRSPARKVTSGFESLGWSDAMRSLTDSVAGDGVAVLCEPSSSPTQARLKNELLAKQPGAKWFEFTSVSQDNALEGSSMVFGSPHRAVYLLEHAKRVVSFDSDFLGVDSATVRLSADFAKGRDADHRVMNRLYVAESDFTATGAAADHRMALRFSQVGDYLAALEELIDAGASSVDAAGSRAEKILTAMADDLLGHRGESVVMVGLNQPPSVHARALRINTKLGNVGKTVVLHAVEGEVRSGLSQLAELTQAMTSGAVKTLLVLGGNPVFYAPADLNLAEAISKVDHSFHLSLYRDETSRACKMHLNASHPLESWGDARSYSGSVCLSQPLISPLFGGKSAVELLVGLLGGEHAEHSHGGGSHDHDQDHDDGAIGMVAVQETVKGWLSGDPGEAWNKAVHDGFVAEADSQAVEPSVVDVDLGAATGDWSKDWSGQPELLFKPASGVFDGRFANSGWLQELPDYITKLTWDNAALVNLATAKKLGLEHEKIVNVKAGGGGDFPSGLHLAWAG